MQTLSIAEAERILNVGDLGSFFGEFNWQLPDPVPSHFLPVDSGRKVAFARIIANTFLDRGPAILWINETGIWRSSEHMDLCDGYRRSFGEKRSVAAAPIHIFDPKEDRDTCISILSLGLFFVWGFEIMSQDRSLAMTISHDEWIEYRYALGQENFISYFDQWLGPFLRPGSNTQSS
jgi:hypothetical protein